MPMDAVGQPIFVAFLPHKGRNDRDMLRRSK
jgi:hypothetical protein